MIVKCLTDVNNGLKRNKFETCCLPHRIRKIHSFTLETIGVNFASWTRVKFVERIG